MNSEAIIQEFKNIMRQDASWRSDGLDKLIEETNAEVAYRVMLSHRNSVYGFISQWDASNQSATDQEIAQMAHKLKPTSQILGFHSFSSLGEEIDTYFKKHGNLQGLKEVVDRWIQCARDFLRYTEVVANAKNVA